MHSWPESAVTVLSKAYEKGGVIISLVLSVSLRLLGNIDRWNCSALDIYHFCDEHRIIRYTSKRAFSYLALITFVSCRSSHWQAKRKCAFFNMSAILSECKGKCTHFSWKTPQRETIIFIKPNAKCKQGSKSGIHLLLDAALGVGVFVLVSYSIHFSRSAKRRNCL